MKGISRLLNKKCKRFKHHIRNILQNDIANKYILKKKYMTFIETNQNIYISFDNKKKTPPPPPPPPVLECLYTAY